MYIKLNLKPQVVEAKTKDELLLKIEDKRFKHIYQLYKGIRIAALIDGKVVRVYNLQKINRKAETYIKFGETRRREVRPSYWRAFVYDIPVDVLVSGNLSIFQENRRFRMVNRDLVNNIKKQLEQF